MGKQVKKRCKPYTPKPINLQGYVNIVRTIDIFLESDNEEKTKNAETACKLMHQYFSGFINKIQNGDATLALKAPMMLLNQMLNCYLKNQQFLYSVDNLIYAHNLLDAFNSTFEYFWARTSLEDAIYFEDHEYEIFTSTINFMSESMFYLTDKDYSFIYEFGVKTTQHKGFLIKESTI